MTPFVISFWSFQQLTDPVSCVIRVALIVHFVYFLLICMYLLFVVHRCHECDKLEVEFAEAAAVLKDHDPPVIFAQVCR